MKPEIRIVPGQRGHTFRMEIHIDGQVVATQESNHYKQIAKAVEINLNSMEREFSVRATWGGDSLPPKGR